MQEQEDRICSSVFLLLPTAPASWFSCLCNRRNRWTPSGFPLALGPSGLVGPFASLSKLLCQLNTLLYIKFHTWFERDTPVKIFLRLFILTKK